MKTNKSKCQMGNEKNSVYYGGEICRSFYRRENKTKTKARYSIRRLSLNETN